MSSVSSGSEEDEEEYEVEKIIAKKEKKGVILFRIRWKGFEAEADTWEPEENLVGCEDLLQRFIRKESEREERRRSRLEEEERERIKEKKLEKLKKGKDKSVKKTPRLVVDDIEEGELTPGSEASTSRAKSVADKGKKSSKIPKIAVSEGTSSSKKRLENLEVEDGELAASPAGTTEVTGSTDVKATTAVKEVPKVAATPSEQPVDEVAPKKTPLPLEEEDDDDDFDFEAGGLRVIEDFDAGEAKEVEGRDDTPMEEGVDTKTEEPSVTAPVTKEKVKVKTEAVEEAPEKTDSTRPASPLLSVKTPPEESSTTKTSVKEKAPLSESNARKRSPSPKEVPEEEDVKPTKQRRHKLTDLPSAMTVRKASAKKVQDKPTDFGKLLAGKDDENGKGKIPIESMKPIPKKKIDKDIVAQALDNLSIENDIEKSTEKWFKQLKSDALKVSYEDLCQAVYAGDSLLVAKALLHDERPDLNNREDTSILMLAAKRGFGDIIGMLIRIGSDVNYQNSGGQTALMVAVESGNVAAASILINSGAYLNVTNTKGETALIRSVKRGQRACVELLIRSGANFSAMSSSTKSGLAIAQKLGLYDIENLLNDYSRYVSGMFDTEVYKALADFGVVLDRFFPLHVLSLCEAEQFLINFFSSVPPVRKGEGNILFLANASFKAGEVRCRLSGECFVEAAILNGVEQQSLTPIGHFILSLSPLHEGENKLVINTKAIPNYHKTKLFVRGFRVRLNQ